MDIDYIKSSKEDRREFTFTKVKKAELLEKIREIGIPILKYVSKDKSFLSNREIYSQEYLLEWMVNTIINLQKRIKILEEI